MKYIPLGKSSLNASTIGLGTWAIGGWDWSPDKEKNAIQSINAALDAGINLIDTAPIYGLGRSEEVVGRAIRQRRQDAILASKCGLLWESPPEGKGRIVFTDHRGRHIYQCNHPQVIRSELEKSLKRLQVDCIDLYQTHWQDPTCPIADTMGTLLELKQEGKIRAIGACNAKLRQLEEYYQAGPLDTDQELFNMIDQGIRGHYLDFTREHGISVLTYSTLAIGLLTAKLDPDREFEEKDYRKSNGRFSPENRKLMQEFLQKLKPMAEELQLSIAQLVLAWTRQVNGVTHLLCGASSTQQARDNARAGEVSISPSQFREIERLVRQHMPNLPPAHRAES